MGPKRSPNLDPPWVRRRERTSLVKNRMREICTSGSGSRPRCKPLRVGEKAAIAFESQPGPSKRADLARGPAPTAEDMRRRRKICADGGRYIVAAYTSREARWRCRRHRSSVTETGKLPTWVNDLSWDHAIKRAG